MYSIYVFIHDMDLLCIYCRLKDLQQREAEFYVYSQTHTPHHDYAMDPTYGRHPHNETQVQLNVQYDVHANM